MNINTGTCRKATYDAMSRYYPAIRKCPILNRALCYLLFEYRIDDRSGRIRVDLKALEAIYGQPLYFNSTIKWKLTTGVEVLEHIQKNLLPALQWSGWSRTEHCRVVINDGINHQLKAIVRQDQSTSIVNDPSRVYTQDGKKYSRYRRDLAREEWAQLAASDAKTAPSGTCKYILGKLNSSSNRPIQGFSQVLTHISIGFAEVPKYTPSPTWKSKKVHSALRTQLYHEHVYKVLRAIEDMPQPFYQPSVRKRTDRVFPLNASFLSLPSSIRVAITKPAGWVELDLSAAHLAIGSELWNIGPVKTLLESGESIWKTFLSQFKSPDLVLTEHFKKALKVATYSAMYGMEASYIKGQFTSSMKQQGLPLEGSDLVKTDLMKAILSARTTAFITVKTRGRIPTPTQIDASIGPNRNEGSVWSTVINSYEAVLMKRILRYEATEYRLAANEGRQPDFRIMLWQHDGCSVRFSRGKRKHIAGMKTAVLGLANHYGFPTKLEVK
jgi:hypothetical protein